MKKDIYSIQVKNMDSSITTLEKYKGKVLLIFNGATHSQFTSQYKELEYMYLRFNCDDFEILDFPTDQFNGQAFEDIQTIDNICKNEYHSTFSRFDKVKVIDDGADELFTYLAKKKKFNGFDKNSDMSYVLENICFKKNPNYLKDPSIKWNFTKFVISRDGKVVKRFEPTCDMDKVIKYIETYLDRNPKGTIC